jgi:hypothetical protein
MKLNIDNGLQGRWTRTTGYNSTYKKLAVKWLKEAFCFVSSSVLADSFELQKRQLLLAADLCVQCYVTATIRHFRHKTELPKRNFPYI